MAKKYAKFGIALASVAALLGAAQILPATVPFAGATIVNANEGQPVIRYGIIVYDVVDGVTKRAGESGRLTSPPKPEDFFYSERVENVVIEANNNISRENSIWYNVYIYWRRAPAPKDPDPVAPAPAPKDPDPVAPAPAPKDPDPVAPAPAPQNTSSKKVLPNTGEANSLLGFLGVAMASLGGLISFKRRQ